MSTNCRHYENFQTNWSLHGLLTQLVKVWCGMSLIPNLLLPVLLMLSDRCEAFSVNHNLAKSAGVYHPTSTTASTTKPPFMWTHSHEDEAMDFALHRSTVIPSQGGSSKSPRRTEVPIEFDDRGQVSMLSGLQIRNEYQLHRPTSDLTLKEVEFPTARLATQVDQKTKHHNANFSFETSPTPMYLYRRIEKPHRLRLNQANARISSNRLKHHTLSYATREHTPVSLSDPFSAFRMDHKRIELIEPNGQPPQLGIDILRPERPHHYMENQEEMLNENQYPILSFDYVQPHSIELLVVITETLRRHFGPDLDSYLESTFITAASLLRHSSLKTSIDLNIVDIILLDRNYANKYNLEDWSYSKQERVMARFCQWVNGLRSETMNWDSAILLNVGHFKSTALGVAHFRSMCSGESGCLAVLDRGFGTGYIIAHELGHQIGAKHDFEVNSDCGLEEQPPATGTNEYAKAVLGRDRRTSVDEFDYPYSYWQPLTLPEFIRRDTIMSGTLYFDNVPLRWSACSRQAIHNYLDSNTANCLRRRDLPEPKRYKYANDYLAKRVQDDMPGVKHSLDNQCYLVLKLMGTRFCGHSIPPCLQLYCQDPIHGACLPMEAAWADGSHCGDNKWCLQGKCVPASQKPLRVDGNWGPWGSWSQCSRECGGGVSFSERECNNPESKFGGNFCQRTRSRMRSCSIQPCQKPIDTRRELCHEIGDHYGRKLGAYYPKLGETTACTLTCLDNVTAVYHGISLPDGTKCYSHRDGICIKGRCWETGCDGILGSQKRFDSCRVCGGDNSTCIKISDTFNGESVASVGIHPRGLITAVRIPKGVTNVFVRKVSPRKTPFSSDSYDDYMLLIFEELKTQIRRGETTEPFVGAELYYSGSRQKEEIVAIAGRLQKSVNIVIRVENPQTTRSLPSIDYHYHVDKSQTLNSLIFMAEKEARRAEEQNYIRPSRSMYSVKGSSLKVDEHSRTLTEDQQSNPPKVHFVWRISDLPSGCNTCAGNSTSYAECYPLVNEAEAINYYADYDFYRPVADYLCSAVPRPPPVIRQCADYCGVRWVTRPIDNVRCSARCGEGIQPIRYVCEEWILPAEQVDKTRGLWRETQFGEQACIRAGLGSALTQPTHTSCQGTCDPVFWIFSNWTTCHAKCAISERHRHIYCRTQDGFEWPLHECFSHGESANHSQAPQNALSKQQVESKLSAHIHQGHLNERTGNQLSFEETDACWSLSECQHDIQWSTSSWSTCGLMDEDMKSLCRIIDTNAIYNKPNIQLIGVRTRQVYCQINVAILHQSLRPFAIFDSGPPWKMSLEFCRKANLLLGQLEEPVSRELCETPSCYRWGQAKMSACSTTCGHGVMTATFQCEIITLDVRSSGAELSKQSFSSPPTYWVNEVSLNNCRQQLSYTPRIFVSADNQSVHVETAERPYSDQNGIELRDTSFNHVIKLRCVNRPCTQMIPVWHTTPWEKCSVSCGKGVRRRQVMCMLETHQRVGGSKPPAKLHGTNYAQLDTSVVVATKLKTELTDPKRCLDAGLIKPPEQQQCHEGHCPQWVPGPWEECQGICEYGIQRRHVRCMLDLSKANPYLSIPSTPANDRSQALIFPLVSVHSRTSRTYRSIQPIEVDPERCRLSTTGSKPTQERLCLLSAGCPFWHKAEWSPCSVSCGMGQRRRYINCRFPNGSLVQHGRQESSVQPVDQPEERMLRLVRETSLLAKCPIPKPAAESTCKTRPCMGNQPFWWPVMSSECQSENCQVGRRNRVIQCITSMKGPTKDEDCMHLSRPSDWKSCVPLRCMRFEWKADPWSNCPRTCEPSSRYRRVRCVDSLGEEYSNALCPVHLKSDNWEECPKICATESKSCSDVQKRYFGSQDGSFQLSIGSKSVSIYCAGMGSPNPKEYIVLRRINFARTSAFMLPYTLSDWCPHINSPKLIDSVSKLPKNAPSLFDTANLTETEPSTKVSANNCPACPYLKNLESVTYYQKIRFDIHKMQILIEDTRFAYSVGQSIVPYATAKDCFGSRICPQGQFQVDLRETGFRVNVETLWETSTKNSAAHIYRREKGQLINGFCGGHCSGCWPQPGLFLKLVEGR